MDGPAAAAAARSRLRSAARQRPYSTLTAGKRRGCGSRHPSDGLCDHRGYETRSVARVRCERLHILGRSRTALVCAWYARRMLQHGHCMLDRAGGHARRVDDGARLSVPECSHTSSQLAIAPERRRVVEPDPSAEAVSTVHFSGAQPHRQVRPRRHRRRRTAAWAAPSRRSARR